MKKRGWLGCLGFAVLLLLAAGVLFAVLFLPKHPPLTVTGPYPPETIRFTWHDPQRIDPYSPNGTNRQVNVVFWYPQSAAPGETFPLVIFSHGGLGTETSNQSLYRELASHGYVVVSIGHPFQAIWTKSDDGRITFVNAGYFGELQREDAKTDPQRSLDYYRKWLAVRTGDINLVMDTIRVKVDEKNGGLFERIDPTRIGVMGHSLGGSAALAMPRLRQDVDAVIALESPFLYDIIGVKNDQFVWLDEDYPVPVLNIYSDSSWPHLTEWPQYARNADLLANPQANSIHLPILGAGHFSLTDLSLVSPLLTSLLEGRSSNPDPRATLQKVNRACLEFFDRYLKNPTRP